MEILNNLEVRGTILNKATTSTEGVVQLNSAINSTSTTMAATASAVKTAYDKANHAHNYLPLAGGNITGHINKIGQGTGFRITNGNASTLMAASSTVGDHIFGGSNDGTGNAVDYLRVGTNKLQYTTGGKAYGIYHSGAKPTAADIGLGNVNNWGASTSINNTSTTTYATASAVKTAYDKANHAHPYAATSHGNHVPTTQSAANHVFLRNDNTWQTVHLRNLPSEAFAGADGDANTFMSNRTWVARSSNHTTNRPIDYCTIFNVGAETNSNFQLAHSYATGNDSFYVRGRHDTSGTYRPWARIYTTAYKPSAADIGAAASSHTHSYVPLSSGGNIIVHADSDSSSSSEYLDLKAGKNILRVKSSAANTSATALVFNNSAVYHTGYKPSPADIGAATSTHEHSTYVMGMNDTGSNKTTDLNGLWKSGFYEIETGSNKPSSSGWHWVLNVAHSSNRTNYKYGMQIAATNNTSEFYMRTTNETGSGTWRRLVYNGMEHDHGANIRMTTATKNENVIRAYNGDVNGMGLSFGGGGGVVVGAGESAHAFFSHLGAGAATEDMYVTADSRVFLASNCNTLSAKKMAVLNTYGNFHVPGNLYAHSDSATGGSKSMRVLHENDITVSKTAPSGPSTGQVWISY